MVKYKKVTGRIEVKTGLHIGAGNDKVEIGGVDLPIIKNPQTKQPYIPGSSIKGKMRALLEWEEDKVKEFNGEPHKCGRLDCHICRIFGCGNNAAQNGPKGRGPTRLIVRDAELTKEFKDKFSAGEPIIEAKSENMINRISAAAKPRSIERIVPGVKFEFELVYRIFDIDDKDEELFKDVVIKGLKLLENDCLGGGGSRGNGRIEFKDLVEYMNLEDETGTPFKL